MVDFGELWRGQARERRAADDARAWDKRAREAPGKYGPSAYSEEFLRLAGLRPGESVLDMGCGAGALAIPCAERGHRVLAADFSPVMLERCQAGVPADVAGLVETRLLAWDDDWEAAGLAPRSFDVAFASRSIATDDMEAALVKLSGVARRKCCITLVAGTSPRVSDALFRDLGLSCAGHQDAAFAFGILCQLGFRPEVRFISSERADRFATREEARVAYAGMLRFADGLPEGEGLACLEAKAREWVDAHLAPAGEGFAIDIPRRFSWAFISWNV